MCSPHRKYAYPRIKNTFIRSFEGIYIPSNEGNNKGLHIIKYLRSVLKILHRSNCLSDKGVPVATPTLLYILHKELIIIDHIPYIVDSLISLTR